MSDSASCMVCGMEFGPVGACCSDACREEFARRLNAQRDEYLSNPDNIHPGDWVSLKTAEDD